MCFPKLVDENNTMMKHLQNHAPTLFLLLLLALIIALFFSPPSARLLSTLIIVFGIGTAILFTVHANWQKHKEGELAHSEFLRNTIIDLLGLGLVMGAAVWLGSLTGAYVGTAWGNIPGIVAAMLVGFAVAFIAGKLWEEVIAPMKAKAA